MIVLMAAAVIPPLALILYIYRLDSREKEPPALMKALFLGGVLMALPVALAEGILSWVAGAFAGYRTIYLLLENFIAVALVEEYGKYYILKKRSFDSPYFDYRFDGIVYGTAVSLGFAALENVLFILDGGLVTAIARALTSIPGHCIFGIYMGYYYGRAKSHEVKGDYAAMQTDLSYAVIVPVALHGLYDFLIASHHTGLFFLYAIILDIVAFRSVVRYAREDRPVGV